VRGLHLLGDESLEFMYCAGRREKLGPEEA